MQLNCIFSSSIVKGNVISKLEPSSMLRRAGLRSTAARRQVLASFLAAGRALSHREIVNLLFGLDRVTVFRSLKNLKKAHLVHSVQGIDGTLRYVLNQPKNRGCPGGHPHFLCLRCGRMLCLANQRLATVRVPEGAKVYGKQFLVYGACASCSLLRGSH